MYLIVIDFTKKINPFQKMKKAAKRSVESVNLFNQNKPQFTVKHDGDYILVVHMTSDVDKPFEATIDIWMQGTHGYLSVVDWYVQFYKKKNRNSKT